MRQRGRARSAVACDPIPGYWTLPLDPRCVRGGRPAGPPFDLCGAARRLRCTAREPHRQPRQIRSRTNSPFAGPVRNDCMVSDPGAPFDRILSIETWQADLRHPDRARLFQCASTILPFQGWCNRFFSIPVVDATNETWSTLPDVGRRPVHVTSRAVYCTCTCSTHRKSFGRQGSPPAARLPWIEGSTVRLVVCGPASHNAATTGARKSRSATYRAGGKSKGRGSSHITTYDGQDGDASYLVRGHPDRFIHWLDPEDWSASRADPLRPCHQALICTKGLRIRRPSHVLAQPHTAVCSAICTVGVESHLIDESP